MKIARIQIGILILFFFITQSIIVNAQTVPNIGVNFTAGSAYLYKNLHYDILPDGTQRENVTKWTKITIDNIDQIGDKTNVTWSKWEVINRTLDEVKNQPDLWKITNVRLSSIIDPNNSISKYQMLFNAGDASLADLTPDIMLNGGFKIFYTNELGYFKTSSTRWQANNTLLNYTLDANITDQRTRIFEGFLKGFTLVQINGTYPNGTLPVNPESYYQHDFYLKLYLVYGEKSNILLSYNINFTLAEKVFESSLNNTIYENTQRRIIYWNIREPVELTEDYPIIEVLDIPNYDLKIIGLISICSFSALVINRKKNMKKGAAYNG